MSQEKLQTMSMQNFWGVKEVHCGIVQVVNCSQVVTTVSWHLNYFLSSVTLAFGGKFLVEETKEVIQATVELFKKHNKSWDQTKVVMSDKDSTEREVF